MTEGAHRLDLGGVAFDALTSGALWAPEARLLCVADLHLGKSERTARRGGPFLPPYETTETLSRLASEIDRLRPKTVLCLGDSFDDARAAESLRAEELETIRRLQAGRRWIWLAGNHDPAPLSLAGEHLAEFRLGDAVFRHIARRGETGPEISGHYHPKATLFARGRRLSRRCFLTDGRRLILPAFGAYTGGLDAADDVFDPLFSEDATALLLGERVRAIPRRSLVAPNASPR